MTNLRSRIVGALASLAALSVLFTAAPLYAQTAPTTTTLAAAITDFNIQTFRVVSATGFATTDAPIGPKAALIDGELWYVNGVTGTTIRGTRAVRGRAETHASGAKVWVTSPLGYGSVPRVGSCTATNELFLPILIPERAEAYDCVTSIWVRSDLASSVGQVTNPKAAGGIPTVYSCGATTGAASCATSQSGYTAHIVSGQSTLSSGSAAVDTITPAFTGTTSFACSAAYANGSSGTANLIVANTSASKITISGSGSALVTWICAGY